MTGPACPGGIDFTNEQSMATSNQKYKRPPSREALRLLASQCVSYFLVVSALCVVSGAILLDVSIIVLDVSGVTVVVSLVSELLPLLLHAAKAVTIIAIANNFFICRILYC